MIDYRLIFVKENISVWIACTHTLFMKFLKNKHTMTSVNLRILQCELKEDVTKIISVHDSIIIILSFGTLFIHIRPLMATQQSIFINVSKENLCKLALFALHGHLRELSQQSNNSCIRTALCSMTKLGRRQFWHALQKWLLNSHPWPNMNDKKYTWKMNMLSCTGNNSMISPPPPLFFFTHWFEI